MKMHPLTWPELALFTSCAAVAGGISGYAFASGAPVAGWVLVSLSAAMALPWGARAAQEISWRRQRRGVIRAAEQMVSRGK